MARNLSNNGTAFFKWAAAGLLSVVLVLGGLLMGVVGPDGAVAKHAAQAGHPVVVERVNRTAEDIKEIKDDLRRIRNQLSELNRTLNRE